jgi:hypothetical protein
MIKRYESRCDKAGMTLRWQGVDNADGGMTMAMTSINRTWLINLGGVMTIYRDE